MSENKDDHHLLPKSATGVFEPVSLEESGQSHEDTSVNSPSNNPPATLPLEQPVEVSPKQPRERTSIRKRNSVTESVGSGVSSKLGGGTSCHSVSTSRIQSSRHSLFGRQRYVKNHSIPDGHESQTNISGLRLGPSLTSLVSEDSFHQPTQMVISPHNPVVLSSQQSHTSQTKIVAGRFSVSPHHHLPPSISHKSVASGSVKSMKTRTKSERSSMAFSNRTPSPEPDVQFMMSDLALHEDVEGEGQQDALTPDMETVDLLSKDFTVEPVDEKELDDGSVQLGGIDDIEDLVYEVDENQRTVQSYFSVNTQDSANFQHAPLMCGNISFVREHTDISEQKKHYVSITSDTEMDLVTHFLRHYWGLKNPKIVLSVISNADNYKPWKNQRLRDDFQKGIIKAANATSMWIITNGIDAGVTKIIGDAVREFNMEQKLHVINHPEISDIGHKKRKLPIIGITPKDMVVPLSSYFHGQEGVTVQMDGGAVEREFYELNPDHSHFIIVEDMPKEFPQDSMRCRLEQQFRIKHGAAKVKRLMSIGSEVGGNIQSETQANTIPVVGLLVQGMPNHIEHILFYLNNKMPVLVLKGSGGLADIIAYAFEELHEKGEADPDFEENVLKPELIKMINRLFPTFFKDPEIEKLTLRDKIIQSVTLSREVVDGDHCYLTVVDVKAWASNMRDLDKFILRSLFRIENTEVLDLREQLQNDLQLTVDWNRPDLAWEIFQHDFVKVRIDKKMFEQSIVKKDREEFIDLFLTQGVRVHSYLNMKKLKYLFEKAEDREIFVNICLEGVVGIVVSPKHPLGEDFMPENLNRLIYKLSKIPDFFQPYKVYQNSVGDYSLDPLLAERKAIIYLIMWAVLMNRQKLAKTLWNRCDEPIGVALVCSRIYKELSKYTPEQYMRIELEANAKEFGEMALGALAICWRDSSLQAYIMLGKRLQDFNNKTVIEIAHDAGYIHFLAHPCCQKWLTKTFLGQLQIKELDWGLFRLPYWFKILMSVFLIFPMYIWITFIPSQKKKSDHLVSDEENVYGMDDSDLSEEDDIDMPAKPGMDPMWKKPKKKAVRKKLQTAIFPRKESNVSFFNKIYLLWTAPITKFWNTQVLYFTYLGLFCLATLWPVCGNQYLDVVLWCWTFVIELELVCRAYIKYHKYKTLSLVGNCLDIFVIMVFLVVLLFTRILHVWVSFSNYMTAKTFLCMFLIYFFYRLLGVYLPISPTLGPMLLRINRMISHDFVAFIRMFLIFMIAGGVAIQASLYPNWPLNYQLLARVITRPMYAMFLTQVSDLEGDALCTKKYKQVTGFCATGDNHFDRNSGNMYSNNTLMEELQTCPYSSVYAYIITLQYIFICKLILVTLLFAMFSLTIAKVDQEASELWKFQRYTLIADFIERFSLPPPFTVFSFLYLFLKFLHRKYMDCRRWCRNWRSFIDPSKAKTIKHRGRRIPQDTQFWKRVAREYVASEQAALERKNMSITQGEILVSIQDNMQSHRKQMKRMNDKVVELEKMIQSSRLCLETIQHKLEKTDVMGITDVKGKFIHVAARQSPYPGTAIARFPVFDKYVPLEVVYDVYDPKTFTLEKSKFPDTEVLYVDEDIIELIKLREEHQILTEEEGKKLAPIPEFEPKWNAVVTVTEDGERREIDRRSWIDINNQPLRYTLDALGIPQNPLGRTGIRGKGNLWRWGPNHVIKAVITRWRRKHSPMGNTTPQFLYVEGKKLLEFIAVQKDTYIESSFGLPGDVLHGYSTPNSILCKSFLQSVLDEPELAQKIEKFDQAEMIQFFSQFSATLEEEEFSRSSSPVPGNAFPALIKYPSSSTLTSYLSSSKSNMRVDSDQKGFSASLIYKGYLDDQRNTDNAWVEAEVWNFHFDLGDSFDARLKEESSVKWKEVSPYVKMFGNESVIVQEAARIHDAYH